MKTACLVLALLFCSVSANAGDNKWVSGKVSSLEDYTAFGTGAFQILITLTDKNISAATSCSARFNLHTSHQGITDAIQNRMYTMLLVALVTQKPVQLYVDSTSGPSCHVNIVRIDR